MKIKLGLVFLPLTIATSATAAPKSAAFIYCAVPSTSPRGRGLIITAIFRSQSQLKFIETAFANYLRNSYAPYGNGWIFPEQQVSCFGFERRRQAEDQRGFDISRVHPTGQIIFNVTFQLA